MAARLPARLLGRQVRSQTCRRPFTTSSHRLDAQNFAMPALSPTMTEGNIANWKIKEGDSFQAGDILLEIETDKATMDVEAQDPGVLVKIFQSDGAKAVQVGTRIAVLGEEGDDPKSLDIPEDDTKPISQSKEAKKETNEPAKQEPQNQPSQESGSSKKPQKSSQASQTASGPGQNKKYPLYPSVTALVHEKHISESDIDKIPATGPNGRLLKGDVLAYLGSIPSDYSSQQSQRISKLAHLDLSNIKIAEKTPPRPTEAPAAAAAAPTIPELPPLSSITLPVSLAAVLATQKRVSDTLGVTIPLSTFLARATDLANDELPRTKSSMETSSDDLFNAVLGLDFLNSKTSRGYYMPQITALPRPASNVGLGTPSRSSRSKQPDIIDVLTGTAKSRPARSATNTVSTTSITPSGGAVNMFSLTVPKGEEKRARTFLERVKTVLQVEPGRLVL